MVEASVLDVADIDTAGTSTSIQDCSEGDRAEVRVTSLTVQDIPDDEWMFNSPYHQDFSKVAGV